MENLINLDKINELKQLENMSGKKIVDRLVDLYVSTTDTEIKTGLEKLHQNDIKVVERTFHSLKSSSGNLGLIAIQALSHEIELICRNEGLKSKPLIEQKILALSSELPKSLAALNSAK